RILKDKGYIALIWNERQLDATPFLREYEQFLLKFANDYSKVRHENVDEDAIREFFGNPFSLKTFENVQIFDFDGLKGRVLSASYMPAETDSRYEQMVDELQTLFAKHNENDRIEVFYDTKVFFSRI